jgi:adenylate kinase
MPGAGKGTISEMLKSNPDITHISTGDLIRALPKDSDLGRKVFGIVNAGGLLDDDMINEIVSPMFSKDGMLLFDGYPRTISQAEYVLDKASGKFDIIAILLAINEQIAEHRRDERVADALANGNQPRADDADPSILRNRFAEYHAKTEPMLKFLADKLGNNFHSIDNSGTAEEGYARILAVLK